MTTFCERSCWWLIVSSLVSAIHDDWMIYSRWRFTLFWSLWYSNASLTLTLSFLPAILLFFISSEGRYATVVYTPHVADEANISSIIIPPDEKKVSIFTTVDCFKILEREMRKCTARRLVFFFFLSWSFPSWLLRKISEQCIGVSWRWNFAVSLFRKWFRLRGNIGSVAIILTESRWSIVWKAHSTVWK